MQNREVAKKFFAEERTRDELNIQCCDCDAPNPQWASVSLGSYFCLVCSGTHRSLGVHISFVRSLTMDAWSDKQLDSMKHGGNRKLKEYLARHGVSPTFSIAEKYGSKAAEAYRQRLKATVEGLPLPSDPVPGTGSQPFYNTPVQRPLDSAPIMGGPLPEQQGAGANVQDKLAAGLWGAWDLAKKTADAAKETAQATAQHAQEKGWVDSVKTLAGDSATYVKSTATTAAAIAAEKTAAGYNYAKETEIGKKVDSRIQGFRGQDGTNVTAAQAEAQYSSMYSQNGSGANMTSPARTPPQGLTPPQGHTPLQGNTPPKVLTPTQSSPRGEKKDLWEDDDW